MPDLKTILPLLPIPVGLGIAALTAWINITIRFAPDAAQAKRETRRIFVVILFVIEFIWITGYLAWLVIWEPPIPPSLLSLNITLYCLGLYTIFLVWWFVRLSAPRGTAIAGIRTPGTSLP